MGQYYYVGCPDNNQYLLPHKFGNGLKLMEFGMSSHSTLTALALLLAIPGENDRGDWTGQSPLTGAWAGKRLVVGGDYADEGRFVPPDRQDMNFYGYLGEFGTDLSGEAIQAVVDVAGKDHPLSGYIGAGSEAVWSRWIFSVPSGMEDFLDLKKARSLQFDSLTQFLNYCYSAPGETAEETADNLAQGLRYLGMRHKKDLSGKVEELELKESADGERVESVRFRFQGKTFDWTFPLKVGEAYRQLGILN